MGADFRRDSVVNYVPISEDDRCGFESRGNDSTLSEACRRCPSIVSRLLALGADPNPNGEPKPPLHYAVIFGNTEVVRLLLAAGADPLAKDELGLTATTVVGCATYDPECVRLVEEAAAPLLAKRKGASVRAVRGKKGYAGLESMLDRALGGDGTFFVMLRRGSAAELARAMSEALGGRLERDAHRRWIAETEQTYYAVVELRDKPWALALLEHDTRVSDVAGVVLARSVSQAGEVVTLFGTETKVYRGGTVVQTHQPSLSGGNPSHAELRREERLVIQDCIEWCQDREIFIPPMYFAADGVHVGVDVEGVKKSDIVDAWIVWAPAP
ncbi:MAG: ankyrin repeat domain-containing protein [Polyangiales bacterium]